MRGLRSTIALFVILLGLGGIIYYDSTREATDGGTGQEKVFPGAKGDQIEEVTVKSESGDVTTIRKDGTAWKLTAPIEATASDADASSLAGALGGIEITRVVDPNPASLAEFGLEKPRIQVDFKGKDQPAGHLYIGDKNPTGAGLYARRNDEKQVFLIGAFNESTLNRSTFDLRDKTLISIPRGKVQSIDIANAAARVVLTKKEKEWRVTTPVDARADFSSSEALIGRLESAQMKSVVTNSVAFGDLKQYGLDNPPVRITVNLEGASPAVLELGADAGPDAVYARDASKSVVATVEKSLADDFRKGLDDYRRRDVFDFRAFNASRAEISWSGKSIVFERVQTEGDKPDVWKRISPGEKELDKATVETLLTTLADFRATSFRIATTGTGLDAPALTVFMKYDQSRMEERATFGRNGADAFAARPDDAGAMVVDAAKLTEVINSLDELVK